jgi:hypothetical protein
MGLVTTYLRELRQQTRTAASGTVREVSATPRSRPSSGQPRPVTSRGLNLTP